MDKPVTSSGTAVLPTALKVISVDVELSANAAL